jgi:hypothetical protein
MTIIRAREHVPSHVTMKQFKHSEDKNKQEWGYDASTQSLYVIFGAPRKRISLYVYHDVESVIIEKLISEAESDSQFVQNEILDKRCDPESYLHKYHYTPLYEQPWEELGELNRASWLKSPHHIDSFREDR